MTTEQRLKLKHEAELLGLTPKHFARVHRRSEARISQAFSGKAPALLERMKKQIEMKRRKLVP